MNILRQRVANTESSQHARLCFEEFHAASAASILGSSRREEADVEILKQRRDLYWCGILSTPRMTIRSPACKPLVISTRSPIVRRVLTSRNSKRSGVRW